MNIWDWFSLEAPQGPDTPFAWPNLLFIDILRVVVCVAAIATILGTPVVLTIMKTLGQRVRIIGCTGLTIVAALTEYHHIGDYTNWRFALNLICSIAVLWGYWSALRYESPSGYFYGRRDGGDVNVAIHSVD